MKSLGMLIMVALLTVLLTTPALAKQNKDQTKKNRNATYQKANKSEKDAMRASTLEKANKIHKQRDDARKRVDDLMQQRLRNIQSDSPGNIGPIGG